MSFFGTVKAVFGGGGVVRALENVALEAIQTDTEKAEARALYVKTLDPNGMMRRDIMRFITLVYGFYLVNAVVLIYFGVFFESSEAGKAMEAITATFTPITGLFGALTTASFGVNWSNNVTQARMAAAGAGK